MAIASLAAAPAQALVLCGNDLTREIPRRTARATSGSAVMDRVMSLGGVERDSAITREVLSGNIPEYLRQLVPVGFNGTLSNGEQVVVVLCVTPDYLAVGSDSDYVRVPLGLPAAARIADELGFFLPTTRIVDAIYEQADVQLPPSPMKPTSAMVTTDYMRRHDATVTQQRARVTRFLDTLTAGQKKDLVLTTRLYSKPGQVAIYGWHRPNGRPIQPLSTVHGAQYADYSHGIRLVARIAYVNGRKVPLEELMRHPELAGLVSSEGPVDPARLQASLY
ncbi:hypothetical protein [Aliiroseovarius sp.]|uniref:hypothetical protein n=1 Tax=Aliiroseovarius sp. TaxID=1872442 RepID=UPI00260902FA|nr:hypothetical protein [Aliiroseovarius sp.]